MSDLDTLDLEHRLTATLHAKAAQLDAVAAGFDPAVATPRAAGARPSRRRIVVAAALAAALLVGAVVLAVVLTSGGSDSPTIPARPVPVARIEIDAFPNLQFGSIRYETKPGLNEIEFVSRGGSHTLVFDSPQLDGFRLTATPGHPARGTVELRAGRQYLVYCAVPGHRQAGMQAVIYVSGDPTRG